MKQPSDDELIDRIILLKLSCPQAFYALCVTDWQATRSDYATCRHMGLPPCEKSWARLNTLVQEYRVEARPADFSWASANHEMRTAFGPYEDYEGERRDQEGD